MNVLTAINIDELIEYDFQQREVILAPWLLTQSLAMIYATRGVGKAHVSLGIAYAVASGGKFLSWQTLKPRGVLFIDGEMPGYALKERMLSIIELTEKPIGNKLQFITPDLQTKGMPDLSTREGQQQIEKHITQETELIIIDNLSTLVRSGRENEAESWQPIQTWSLSLRARGKSVLFIHHSGKGGQQRGTSRREDVLDTVISLKRPEEYTPKKGACFEVSFEKARYIYGDAVQGFHAQLTTDKNEQQYWAINKASETNFDKVAKLLNSGCKQQKTADQLKLNKGTISRYAKQAKELGLVHLSLENA